MSSHIETIAALATPQGKGGVAIIRVSGPKVHLVIEHLLQKELTPRVATFARFLDGEDLLDEGIAIFFPNPNSFTGEDVLELHGHGGPVISDMVLEKILSLNVRLARPGEFTERAFLNNKIDLTQAEAVADLIDATSREAVKCGLKSLSGEFSKKIGLLNEAIIHLRVYIEAAIDFADEEIDFLKDDRIQSELSHVTQQISEIISKAEQGSILREGITAVIVGEPNVGKSSLLNALSGKELAIVTSIPGTTRDIVRDHILIDGLTIHLLDTAGLRESVDVVEQEGIRRAYQEVGSADLVLVVFDANHPQHIPKLDINEDQKCIYIRNKIDLLRESPNVSDVNGYQQISVSIKETLGLDFIKECIKAAFQYQSDAEGIYLARRRHLNALEIAKDYLCNAKVAFTNLKALEFVAEDLKLAQRALSEITGEFSTDDLLGKIFSTFCIGK